MNFGYTRVVEAELTPAMVGQELNLVGAQGISSVTLTEWGSSPVVTVAPMPQHCLLLVSSKTRSGWKSCMCPSNETLTLELDEGNALDALIVGIVP
jgi:hypothetical protein